MSQNVNLSFSGIFTSISDFNGLPPGAVDIAENIECPYKNIAQPRRGFEELSNSDLYPEYVERFINFPVGGVESLVGIISDDTLLYYNEIFFWQPVPGNYSLNVVDPDAIYARSRFLDAGQNLYVTARDGIRSLASGNNSNMLRAGVPKALNIEAVANNDPSGFFGFNQVTETQADTTITSPTLTNVNSLTGIEVGQFISGPNIPDGTLVSDITPSAVKLVETGDVTAGSFNITNLASVTGLIIGDLVSGLGIYEGSVITAISAGPAPFTVTINLAAYQTTTGTSITFSSANSVTMSQAATATASSQLIKFYVGAQVGYKILYGRIEFDQNGASITRLGAPSPVAIATNTNGHSVNVVITATLPKNSEGLISFYQLYRSPQTTSSDIPPADQFQLVSEEQLTPADFVNRTITITDVTPDNFGGIRLYTGSDQEGASQANDPPPMAWDITSFRDFLVYGNVTFPSTLEFTIIDVGPPTGIQAGDQITISGNFNGVVFSESYTAALAENAAAREFEVVTSGTPSQNQQDTADSLIRVINYDNAVPVHAFSASSTNDLPGKVLLEADYPTPDTFSVTASLHPNAYDPELTAVSSKMNINTNFIAVSKVGELEAVPTVNTYPVGDSSSPIVRVIGMRDYILVLKLDGIYKILGNAPNVLQVTTFDLTTKIIGPDTAVKLNSAVWMLSSQGVVSITDAGVDAKSVPIDDQLNSIVSNFLGNVLFSAFGIGYESDRKYILCMPTSLIGEAQIEYNFSYISNAWTTWKRNIFWGFVSSDDNKLYISRADTTTHALSRERKQFDISDYSDESINVVITNTNGLIITLNSIVGITIGDVLFQSSILRGVITQVGPGNTITLDHIVAFSLGAAEILTAYTSTIVWKQVFADNPSFQRQYSEGLVLFKSCSYYTSSLGFSTDYSLNTSFLTLPSLTSLTLPATVRFYIPPEKQFGSYLLPTFTMRQAYSYFILQGISIAYENISEEVGFK